MNTAVAIITELAPVAFALACIIAGFLLVVAQSRVSQAESDAVKLAAEQELELAKAERALADAEHVREQAALVREQAAAARAGGQPGLMENVDDAAGGEEPQKPAATSTPRTPLEHLTKLAEALSHKVPLAVAGIVLFVLGALVLGEYSLTAISLETDN